MIHFVQSLQNKTLQIIKETPDCADILHDLKRIEWAKTNVYSYGGISAANQLDQELRQKYPTIDMILNIANTMRANPLLSYPPRDECASSMEEIAIKDLQQDYCGILCDTALKKQLVHELKDCIEFVD